MYFDCPYLNSQVELTEERLQHIIQTHPELINIYQDALANTLFNPDQVRLSSRFNNTRLFTKWFKGIRQGKYLIIVVVNDSMPNNRNWIITAYIARKLTGGIIEWQKT
jgi:hypothetical protein